ncbi:xanthine dehydrogenase family protein molybdopterin-binding subunit [Sphingosinicella rhizophila]|uniref:Molybdopterin cofactor-binding domain-containing protein n=1 Tax=Sphingosinicella rhizophila TaxID=3050082 RepID=A0ABU3Q864_9SPHN|nr:molybdopterin cofactor-binding domain-containing protein [Sphingosinicella sp. GR2756]MDT9599284.1 molybdopterin cofactor-binding domain-containing protein [Sphingosinicella sp. GR2756]
MNRLRKTISDTGGEKGISRRTLLIGGGAGVGLLIAFAIWPRSYQPNLRAGPGEQIFNAFLKIADDGRVVVVVPQAEIGQGVWTSLPQILADELGADWRTISVEPAPISPLYANRFIAEERAARQWPDALEGVGRWTAGENATRNALMLTGGSTSIRAFEPVMREAGAAARALLSKAAAKRWNVDWEVLDTAQGFVLNGSEKLSFAELAAEAAQQDLPEYLPVRGGAEGRLVGQELPRLDVPSKVDGTALFAGDIRMPDMVYASSRSAPTPDARLVEVDRKAAQAIPGVVGVFENPRWAAAIATNWWAANRGLEAMKPVFEMRGEGPDDARIEEALAEALDKDEGSRIFNRGDVGAVYAEGNVLRAHYSAGVAANAPIEPLTATARLQGDRLEVYAPTQAPGLARAAAAHVSGLPEAQVTIYPTLIGGGYGRKLEMDAIVQVAEMAVRAKRPVQLVWSRIEETVQDTFRPPARAVLSARLGEGGFILAWQARITAPAVAPGLGARLGGGQALMVERDGADGAIPPYAIPAVAVDHLPVEIGIRTGAWRSGSRSYTVFFMESFIDELARQAGVEPLSFRMQMLGDNPRLARCLSTAAALGGWDGGGDGSTMGIAAHSGFGSHMALLVEIEVSRSQRIRVRRAVAAVDCGRVVNPDIVRQQIEGGIMFGISAAVGNPISFEGGRPDVRGFAGLGLLTLAGSPEVMVELIPSDEPPGGVTELAVPAAAPAIANAFHAVSGARLRSLPLVVGSGA